MSNRGLALFLFLIGSVDATLAEAAVKSYSGSFYVRGAAHTEGPLLASNRQNAEFEQRSSVNDQFSFVIGGRAWNETAYAINADRYPTNLLKNDSVEVSLRDVYLQYKTSNWFLRFGNQQVVWGEAFGFFYSDIVNPKDLREGGFGEFAAIRRQIPILNTKFIFSNFALQGLFIPNGGFNVNPMPGSDFAPSSFNSLGVSTVEVQRQLNLPLEARNSEAGARLTAQFGGADISLFYLSYFDRVPYYSVNSSSTLPTRLILDENHSRISSLGFTASYDLNGYMLRFEGLQNSDRLIPVVVGSSLSTARTDEFVYVGEVDFPTWNKFNFGLQWSESILSNKATGLLRSARQSLLGFRMQRSTWSNQSFDFFYAWAANDAGSRIELNYYWPLTGVLEAKLGAQILGGSRTSEFGALHAGSRVFAELKVFFKDI